MLPEEARANLKQNPVAYGTWVFLLVLQAIQFALGAIAGLLVGLLLMLVFPPLALIVLVGVGISAVILWGIYAIRPWIAVLQWLSIGMQAISLFVLNPTTARNTSTGTRGIQLILSVVIALLYIYILRSTKPRNDFLPPSIDIPDLPKFKF